MPGLRDGYGLWFLLKSILKITKKICRHRQNYANKPTYRLLKLNQKFGKFG